MAPKQVYFETKVYNVFPSKIKRGFRRPHRSTWALAFSVQRRTKKPINSSSSLSVLCSLVVHKNCKNDRYPSFCRVCLDSWKAVWNVKPPCGGFQHKPSKTNKQTNKTACETVDLRWAKLKLQKYTASSPGNFPSHLGKFVWFLCFDSSLVPISLYCVYDWVG